LSKATPFLSASNAGEFSPKMDARVDFEKYPAAIARGLNLICLPQGGVTLRPGTRFVKEAKASSSESALIPFDPVSDQAYMIEAGDLYFRFLRNQGWISAPATTTAITNGAFGANITGWTNRSTGGGSIAWHSSGRMALTGAANGFGWAEQALTVASGDQATAHVVRFELVGNPGSKVTAQVGTATLGYSLLRSAGLEMGWHTITFAPGTGTVYLQFLNEQADTVYVDNISVLSDVPIELTSPYAAADVGTVRVTQSADVLYLFHGSYAPYRLDRRGDTSWSLAKVFWQDGPWLGVNPDTDLAAQRLDTNGSFDGGLAGWTQVGTTSGYVDYDSPSGVVLLRRHDTAGSAAIRQSVTTGAPTKLHVMHFQTVGGGQVSVSVGSTAGGGEISGTTNYVAGWYTISFTPGVSPFHLTFSADQDDAIAGGVGGVFVYNTRARMLQASGATGSVTITALDEFRPFAATDIGRLIRIEHAGREPGWAVITAYTDAQHVTAWVHRKIASVSPTETWRLGAWSDTTGWPRTATFHQQRLLAARTDSQPQTLWGSQTADFEHMRPDSWVEGATTVEDDDALDFTLAATRVSPILWLIGARRLVVGTSTGQWAVASRGSVLTPSDFAAEPQTSVKGLDIAPIQIDSVGLFAHRSRRSLYDIGFSFEIDGFQASDTTILSQHIARGGIAQIVYQEEPFSQVWARLEDGKLAVMTYKRAQNVIGWTPVEIAGSAASTAVVESIAVIPGGSGSGQVYSSEDRDELWLIVRRTIGGATKRYIEVMEGYYEGPNRGAYQSRAAWEAAQVAAQKDAVYLDCAATYDGAATTTITGLSHLEGETVMVVADGALQQSATVASGQITLRTAAALVHVGLDYEWAYKSLKLPYGSPSGSSVGLTKTVNGLVFVVLDSAPFEYGVELSKDGNLSFNPVPFRRGDHAMGTAAPLFTGEVEHSSDGGFDTDPRVWMRGNAGLPWTLLGITPRVDTRSR
jgi:hypothetical protein